MVEIPSRETLTALQDEVRAIVPVTHLGFARRVDDDRVAVLYAYPYGIGEYVMATTDAPEALHPTSDAARHSTVDAAMPGPIGWMLRGAKAQGMVSVHLPHSEPITRFWIGLIDAAPLTGNQIAQIESLVAHYAPGLTGPLSAERTAERLRRLELAAELLPALMHVLDVRDVFERLSVTAKRALRHDLLLLNLFSDDLSQLTMYARSDRGSTLGKVIPTAYPLDVVQSWNVDIIDDYSVYPGEKKTYAAQMGAQSSIRFPIKYDERVIGTVAFLSFTPSIYTIDDVAVGRRLSAHVAGALSHHALAVQLAEQARHNEELRARETNLSLLDQLLEALIDAGDLADVFGNISTKTQQVLPHDAALLMVRLPDGVHARVYASSGYPGPIPPVTEIPPEILEDEAWDHHIFDDLSALDIPRYARLAAHGFRSVLRVPIRFEGKFAGALVFLSKTVATFQQRDVTIARRIADRLAITLAHDREIQASLRADEATERATRLEARVRALTDELNARSGFHRVVGESPGWRAVLTQATQVSATDTTVLLLGESGTGKEVLARFLHRASTRSNGPFIALNCAALPEQLLEAELFGYERGAFTGAVQSKPGQLEQAAGGTLFLDEVGEMSPSAQAKFLRVLQEREFQRLGGTRVLRSDARIIAATNRDLQRSIANGQFREDLYYRLNVFAIRLPPLRERRDDVLPLSDAFLAEIGRGLARPAGGIAREARQMLVEYHWPGNVRELRNILERAAILCDGGLITTDHLALKVAAPPPSVQAAMPAPTPMQIVSAGRASSPPASDLNSVERAMIEQALVNAQYNKSKAAKALGLSRHQLYIRMRKHGFA